jgi:ATP-binding cassette subfamily C (CFTR/MRP) protein 1
MTALMRLVEIESGKILIDGVDIRLLGLQRVRSKIAVIPQDPVLFSGTIQTNLDPFGEFSPVRLQYVLKRVGLMDENNDKACVQSLEDEVMEGGNNFSVGQRQLLVIGRALLQEASVIICDEATAAVDAETDARMQAIFRIDFKHATCLTVAHRLNTIMDSDYVLVMHDGKAAEFDTPGNLLEMQDGIFRGLVHTWEKEHSQ